MGQGSPTADARPCYAAGQEISCFYKTVYNSPRKSSSLYRILGYFKSVRISTSCLGPANIFPTLKISIKI
jgi:hypothetical protein